MKEHDHQMIIIALLHLRRLLAQLKSFYGKQELPQIISILCIPYRAKASSALKFFIGSLKDREREDVDQPATMTSSLKYGKNTFLGFSIAYLYLSLHG